MDTPADSLSLEQAFASAEASFPIPREPSRVAKIRYTHVDMIDFIIANPQVSQGQLAARYGYTQAWVSNIMASDAWQSALAARREEVIDPALKETIAERMKGLTLQSINVLQEKLAAPSVSDTVALKAFELGSRALGFGQPQAPAAAPSDSLELLAKRLIELNRQYRPAETLDVVPTERIVA